MVSEDDRFLAKNVGSPFVKGFHNGKEFFLIHRVNSNGVTERIRMKHDWVT